MKIRPSILLLCVAAFMLIVIAIWFRKPATTLPSSVIANPPQVVTPNRSGVSPKTFVQLTNDNNSQGARHLADVIKKYRQGLIGKSQAMQETLSTENDIPIVFYGKLEDQFGDPISGAEVSGSTIIYNGTRTGSAQASTISDVNGFFKLDIGKGESLGVMPKKAGYVLATTSTFFKYSHLESNPYIPDMNNPTVIRMWKLQGAEHLISFSIKTYVPVDATAINFNLLTGQQVQSGGDLTIRIQGSANPSVRKEYDWQVSVQMVDGGIIQDFSGLGLQEMFQAPDSGYTPEFNLSFQKGAQQWTSRFLGGFYFTSRNGRSFGKMAVSIITDRIINGGAPVTINGYLNPSGSRNLEIDPAKVTEAQP